MNFFNKYIKTNNINSLRTDGIYLCRHAGISDDGKPYQLSLSLIFNNLNYVLIDEEEGFHPIDKSIIPSIVNDFKNYNEFNNRCTIYNFLNGKIYMKFKENSIYGDDFGTEFVGSIINGCLILDRIVHYFDLRTKSPRRHTTIKNMKFEFLN